MYIEELYEEENISSYLDVRHAVRPAVAYASGPACTNHGAGNTQTL
jgi:hypothetical protein